MPNAPDLVLTDTPDAELEAIIQRNFHAYAAAQGVATGFQHFAIELRRDGELLGGLMARVARGWLYLERIALPLGEQGAGLGRQLVEMAEAEAIRRGCKGAYLFTVQFQAPGFYQKLGYTEFGRLPDDPPELTRIWFSKRFGQP